MKTISKHKLLSGQFLVLTLLATVLLSACQSPLNVNTDYDKRVDFSQLKTFKWHDKNQHNTQSRQYLGNDIMDERIRMNVELDLAGKGFQKIDADTAADFFVNYSIMVKDKTDIRTYNTYNGYAPGFRYGFGYGSYGSSMGMAYQTGSDTRVIDYQQGTLVIDIINPETDKLIWRGSGDGRLPESQSRQEREEMVKKAVTEIMKDFPPPLAKEN